jgi:hypothetical protein
MTICCTGREFVAFWLEISFITKLVSGENVTFKVVFSPYLIECELKLCAHQNSRLEASIVIIIFEVHYLHILAENRNHYKCFRTTWH